MGEFPPTPRVFLCIYKRMLQKKSCQFAEDGFPAVIEHFTLKRHPLVNPSIGDGDGYVTVVGVVMGHFRRINYLITSFPSILAMQI